METTPSNADDNTSTVILVAYIVGSLIILGVLLFVCLLVKKVRWRSAKKYIKRQSNRSIPMQNALSDHDPPPKQKPRPWSAKSTTSGSVANIRQQRMEVRIQYRKEKRERKAQRKEEKLEMKRKLYSSAGPVVTPPVSARKPSQIEESTPTEYPGYLNQVYTPPPSPPTTSRSRTSLQMADHDDFIDNTLKFEAQIHTGSSPRLSGATPRQNVTEL